MTLQPHLASVALKRKPAARGERAPRAPSIVDVFCRLPWLEYDAGSVVPKACHLALVAARGLPAARHGDATSMVVRAPPLEVGQQLWGRLRRGPRTTSQRGYPMADRQWSPFNKSGIQPPRKAHSLQRSFEGGFCPQAHHVGDTHQLAPKVSFFSPDHRSAPVPLATGVLSGLGDLPVATVQNER